MIRQLDSHFVRRGADRTPANSGQWGVALRYFAEEFGQTEFGFYLINYHSRLPVIGAQQSSRNRSLGRPLSAHSHLH